MTDKDTVKGYTFRIDESIINDIDIIADKETEKTGYKIDRSNIVRKLLHDFVKQYKEQNK